MASKIVEKFLLKIKFVAQLFQSVRSIIAIISGGLESSSLVQSRFRYIKKELVRMKASIDEAIQLDERATVKNELKRKRELVYEMEDCLDEFKRRLVHPTDKAIVELFLQIGTFLATWTSTCFLQMSACFGPYFRRTGAYFQSIGSRLLRTGTCLLRTAVELYDSLLRTGLELGIPLLIRTRLELGIVHPTDHEITCGLLLWIGMLLCVTWAGTCILKISTCFLRTSTGVLFVGIGGNGFIRTDGASDRLVRTGVELGTVLLRTGSHLFRTLNAIYHIFTEPQRIKDDVGFISPDSNALAAAAAAKRLDVILNHSFRLRSLFIEDNELVGIDGPRDELLKWLLEGKEQTCVISVVGCGGLGKTTLVGRVFQSERVTSKEDGGSFGPFLCREWIPASESFRKKELLKKLHQKLFGGASAEGVDDGTLIENIQKHLRDKRYVIVFDDLWSVEAWEYIKFVFPNNKKGSRIIVTTRDEIVARTCCFPNHELFYELPALSPEQSMTLFCKQVFNGRPCPEELEALSRDILNICDGLPLVIVTIGVFLASKEVKIAEDWEKMLEDLGSGLEINTSIEGMKQIMALCYYALPSQLKSCFLCLSMYPKGSEIRSKELQAIWIAEELVKRQDCKTPEEVAESYFEQLVRRSMIKRSKINRRGLIKRCRVHDVMLAFIVSKSKEADQFTLRPKYNMPEGAIRRLSLHVSDNLPLLTGNQIRSDHLRSLFMFGIGQSLKFLICQSRLLRVLKLNNVAWLSSSDIGDIGKLYHLQYLELQHTNVDHIPISFADLHNLETLDIRFTVAEQVVVPAEVVNLPKLRHLRASRLSVPQGLGSSNGLQTVDCFCLHENDGELQELRKLRQLRKLGVSSLGPKKGAYIGEMLHFNGDGFLHLKHLSLHDISSLKSLEFGPGSMPELEVLTIARCASLERLAPNAGSLPRLKEVVIRGMNTQVQEKCRAVTEAHPNKPIFRSCP